MKFTLSEKELAFLSKLIWLSIIEYDSESQLISSVGGMNPVKRFTLKNFALCVVNSHVGCSSKYCRNRRTFSSVI